MVAVVAIVGLIGGVAKLPGESKREVCAMLISKMNSRLPLSRVMILVIRGFAYRSVRFYPYPSGVQANVAVPSRWEDVI